MLTTTRKFWLIAVVCGLLAAVVFYQFMQQIKSQYQTSDTISVVTAAENIPANTVITAKQLETVELPAQYVHANAVKSTGDIVGQATVTDIAKGEVIISDRLVMPGSQQASFSYKLEPGQRAITVGIDPVSGVAGYIQAGDRVDILALFEVKIPQGTGSDKEVPVSTVVVQNREVLAVGNNTIVNDPSTKDTGKTLTLAMTLTESQKVAWASQFGVIHAVLRSPVDDGTESNPPITTDDMLTY